MKWEKEDIERVRNIKIADELGVQIRRGKVMIPCPMLDHADKTASFLINDDNNYHCFGCSCHGYGFIDFYTDVLLHSGQAKEKKDAFKIIMQEYGNKSY